MPWGKTLSQTGRHLLAEFNCAFCVPHVCRSFCDLCLINIRKVMTISCRISSLASKSDIPSALWLKRKSEKIFENFEIFKKKFQNFRFFFKKFSDFHLSHRALGRSNFDARGLIRQEIVSTFRILIKHRSQNDLHTCGTQKAHHAKNAFFVPVVCSSQCA